MSSTIVIVRRDKEGNVYAHWTGSVTFDPDVFGDPGAYRSMIEGCVENFRTQLEAEISADFQGLSGRSPG